MPILRKCCYCCELGTGGITLGWITLIVRCLMLATLCFAMGNTGEFVRILREKANEPLASEEKEQFLKVADWFENSAPALFAALTIIVILYLVASVCLIMGAMNRRRMLLLPFLILDTLSMIYWTLMWLASFASIAHNPGGFIMVTLFTGLNWYWYLSIIALFQEITEQSKVRNDAILMRQHPVNPNVYQPTTVGFAK